MTTVEYSLTGDSVIKNNIKMPKDTYGKVLKVLRKYRFIGKTWKYYTGFTIELNDGRTIKDELNGDHTDKIKEGNAMSVTETYYPFYNIEYNFN